MKGISDHFDRQTASHWLSIFEGARAELLASRWKRMAEKVSRKYEEYA
jgi:hypothetical protein